MSSTTMSPTAPLVRGLPMSLPPVNWWFERLPVVVLALSVVFLQGYALRFWEGLLGRPGWGTSAGLEVLHLWFWYRAAKSARIIRLGWMVLAVAATGLLLAGTLHEVSQPLFQESSRIEAIGQERKSLETQAEELRANLEAYRDMAAQQGRRGWQEDIRRDTARLEAITGLLRRLITGSNLTARRPWLNQVTHGGVVAVAVLFQLAAVLALWRLSGAGRKPEKAFRRRETPNAARRNVSEAKTRHAETFRKHSKHQQQEFYGQLWGRIEEHARSNRARLARGNGKISQASLARDLGISPPDLSGIKLLALGQSVPRNPSRQSVETLSETFGIEMPK